MQRIAVVYHHENQTWWAESADLPGFSAAGASFAEARVMVAEGVDFYLDGEEHVVHEALEGGALLDLPSTWQAASTGWYSTNVVTGMLGEGLLPTGPQGLVIHEPVAA